MNAEARRGGRPGGGNITGVTISGGLELIGKRMGLLVEAMPELSAVARLHQLPLDVLVELSEGMFSICEMQLSPGQPADLGLFLAGGGVDGWRCKE